MARRTAASAAVALLLIAAGCNDGTEDIAETGDAPTTTTTEATTTTVAEATTTSAPAEEPLALWPAPDIVFTDPVAAATDFIELVLGAGEAGEFRAADSRSGEVDVLSPGEGGGAPVVRSILVLRQLGEQDGWFVIAAENPNASFTTPEPGAEVPAAPLAVEGVGRGFEAQLNISARLAGQSGDPLDEVSGPLGGSAETPEPFSVTLDLSGAAPGDVVILLVRGGVGLETDPGEFGAIPVVIGG